MSVDSVAALDDSELCHIGLAVLSAIARDDGGYVQLTEQGELVIDVRGYVPAGDREYVERFLALRALGR